MTTQRLRQAARSRWRRRLPWLGLTAGLGLILTAGVGSAISVSVAPQIGTVPSVQTPVGNGAWIHPAPRVGTPPRHGTPVPAGKVPRRLALPSLHVEAPIVPVRTLPGGGLAVPDDPHMLGWWQAGARPGSGQGSVVIDGHVDTAADGTGTLLYLRELRPGDPVVLSTDHEVRNYVIAAVRSYPKADLPSEVFDTAGRPRLVIVTCGGTFNKQTRQYSDNVVAYAVPAPPRLAPAASPSAGLLAPGGG